MRDSAFSVVHLLQHICPCIHVHADAIDLLVHVFCCLLNLVAAILLGLTLCWLEAYFCFPSRESSGHVLQVRCFVQHLYTLQCNRSYAEVFGFFIDDFLSMLVFTQSAAVFVSVNYLVAVTLGLLCVSRSLACS